MSTSTETAPNIHVFDDAEAVARAAAERIVDLANAAKQEKGSFSIALAGGSTPRRVYELLASEDFANRVEWRHVHVFFGDERCVPPSHADSNYRMANESLLSRAPLPEMNVHAMTGEGDAVANARLYEDDLREFFDGASWPAFDLILLGMGDDGHTASLFPGTEALGERTAWVVANWVDKFKSFRITLTAPAINHAARIMFIVTGAGKADRLPQILGGERDPQHLPSQLIRPESGALDWYLDEAAAAKL